MSGGKALETSLHRRITFCSDHRFPQVAGWRGTQFISLFLKPWRATIQILHSCPCRSKSFKPVQCCLQNLPHYTQLMPRYSVSCLRGAQPTRKSENTKVMKSIVNRMRIYQFHPVGSLYLSICACSSLYRSHIAPVRSDILYTSSYFVWMPIRFVAFECCAIFSLLTHFPSRTSWCYVPHRRWLALRKSENEEPRRVRWLGGMSGCEDEYKRSPEDYLIMTLICSIYVQIYYGIYIRTYIYLLLMCAVGLCIYYVYIYDILRTIYNIRLLSLYIYIYTHTWHVFSFPTMVWGKKQGYQLAMSWKQQLWSESREVLKQLRLKEYFLARSWLRMSEDMEWEDLTKYVNRCSRMMDCKWKTSHRWRIQD